MLPDRHNSLMRVLVVEDEELLAAAVFLVGAFLLAWVVIRLASRPVVIARRLTPTLTHEGDVVAVTVSIGNVGGR